MALSKSCDNASERLIRDMVMGKKAYLFCRDLDACKRAAMMYSLFGACKVLDKNPERWLCYVLKHIDSTPEDISIVLFFLSSGKNRNNKMNLKFSQIKV